MKKFLFFTAFILAFVLLMISCKKSDCAECASPNWSFIADGNRHSGKITRTDFTYDSSGVSISGYENINTNDTNIIFIDLDARPAILKHTLMNISCDTVGFQFYHQPNPGQSQSNSIGYSDNAGFGLKGTITNFDSTTGYISVIFSGTVYEVENSVVTGKLVNVTNGYFVTKVY